MKKVSKLFVIDAAVSAFFLPNARDQATFARRLDRLTRQYERLEHSLTGLRPIRALLDYRHAAAAI